MVAGPGSARTRAGAARASGRPRAKVTAKSKAGKPDNSSQRLSLGADGKIRVSRCATSTAGSTAFDKLQQEALQEIFNELVAKPAKIFPTARMVKDESYYTTGDAKREDWIHHTIITLAGVPKKDWIVILSAVKTEWTETVLRTMDKHYQLRGIDHLVRFLTGAEMSDHLPPDCHYRPCLCKVMGKRITEVGLFGDVRINVKTGEVQGMEVYRFVDPDSNSIYKNILHIRSDQKAPIGDDYTIKVGSIWQIASNWSWRDARLKGQRDRDLVYDLFLDSDMEPGTIDAEHFLDDLVAGCRAEFANHLDAEGK